MNRNESALIENFIERIPVVGPLWVDALYTWIGVADALNMRKLQGEFQSPPKAEVIDLVQDSTEALRAA